MQKATSGRHGRHDSGPERSTTAKLILRDGPDQSQHAHLTILREALAFAATASEVIHVDGESVGRAATVARCCMGAFDDLALDWDHPALPCVVSCKSGVVRRSPRA